MIQITSEQIDVAKTYVPEVDEYLKNNDLDELLISLNFAIVEFGYDEQQEHLTKEGLQLQKLYDDIYYQNQPVFPTA